VSRLSAADVALSCAAAVSLPCARLLLVCAPGRVVRRATRRPRSAHPDAAVRAAALAVSRVAARAPFRFTCLDQAIALVSILVVLRRAGRVVLGVGPDGAGIRAHAWVDCGGEIVLGGGGAAAGVRALDLPRGRDARGRR
jgi:hypothetical protein